MYSFPNFEPVCCSCFGSKCCFLTCIPISQEAGQVVWYSHLFRNFPQFVMVRRVKGFSVVNEAEVDVFLEFFCFSMVQWMLAIWSIPLPFSQSGLYIWPLSSHVLLKPNLKRFWASPCQRVRWIQAWLGEFLSITLLACEMSVVEW